MTFLSLRQKTQLGGIIKNLSGLILDRLLPPRCLSCGEGIQDVGRICMDCWKELNFLSRPLCDCCGYPFNFTEQISQEFSPGLCAACQRKHPPFRHARAALRYDDGCRRMIISYKHGDRTDYETFFTRMLMQASQNMEISGAVIAPVPLHEKRLKKRRYNQAALIAKNFSEKKSLDYIPDLLIRRKYTPPQSGNYGSRKRNVAGAFRVTDKYSAMIRRRPVLLIDDVYTTGATVRACAAILRRAGSGPVDIITIARVCAPL